MRLRRLGWAGIELDAGGERLVVDHVLDPGIFKAFYGDPRDELIAPDPGRACAALITHLHRDHADVAALQVALSTDGIVLRPARKAVESALDEAATGEAEKALTHSPLDVRACRAGDAFELGPFSVVALAASDGFGSPQISWLIESDGKRVIHGGDTIWHGAWWDIALAHGPIDVACLPANGAEVSFPGWQPAASVPAVMTAEHAVEAARALQARLLVPIHYNRTFDHPEYYRPAPAARERIDAHAARLGVPVRFLDPGDWIEVGPGAEPP